MGKALYKYLSGFSSLHDYLEAQGLKRQLQTREGRQRFLRESPLSRQRSGRIGFKVRSYRSGEITGAQFMTGRQFKVLPPSRSGEVVSDGFTQAAKNKIRRAVECSTAFLGKFCTLTFAPSMLHPWHFDENGCVRHDFAKWKLKKFLDACSVKQRRLGRVLNYLWVAELQDNGNIHFHILWDQFFPIKWLTKIWGQAANSVDIAKMNNPLHAANYMRKYITKDQTSRIRGNRYNISAGLRATMKPIEKVIAELTHSQCIGQKGGEILEEMRDTLLAAQSVIEAKGGRVIDAGFGFSIPVPRSSKEYTDRKTGEKKMSKAVDPRLGKRLVNMLSTFGEQINAQIAPF